jgi:uncharacterized protein
VPKYVLFGSYCDDVLEKRAPYRQAHLDRLRQLKEQNILVTIGPTKDLTKVFGVYDAPDEVAAKKLIEDDPYWKAGVWTEYTIKEWIQAL